MINCDFSRTKSLRKQEFSAKLNLKPMRHDKINLCICGPRHQPESGVCETSDRKSQSSELAVWVREWSAVTEVM